MPTPLLISVAFLLEKYLEVKIMETIKIKQTKSRIGAPKDQKRTLDSLGLRKMGRVVELENTPSNLGRIKKVRHLVTVIG